MLWLMALCVGGSGFGRPSSPGRGGETPGEHHPSVARTGPPDHLPKVGIRDGSGRAEPPLWLGLTPPDLSYPPSSTGASIISAATSRHRLPSPHNMT